MKNRLVWGLRLFDFSIIPYPSIISFPARRGLIVTPIPPPLTTGMRIQTHSCGAPSRRKRRRRRQPATAAAAAAAGELLLGHLALSLPDGVRNRDRERETS